MLDIESAQVLLGTPIQVNPSNNLFEELGNNTYDYKDLLSELIDNSVAARFPDRVVHVNITLGMSDSDPRSSWLSVADDAQGILQQRLGEAISPGAVHTTGSLNEHGLGMKQAIAGLGELKYLATKTKIDSYASVIEQFQFGTIYPKQVTVPWASGTEIVIEKLKSIVRTTPTSYTRDLVPYLGARYRRFLTPSSPRAQVTVQILDIDDGNKPLNTWQVKEVKPFYFHPKTRTNAPIVDHRVFNAPGWEAELVFGYSPEGHEWAELGLEQPSKFEPYAVTLSKQGLDVFLNDRVIMFHQLPELGLVGTRHNNYNGIRGEIILKSGFTTATTKNSIVHTEHWAACMSAIKEFLDEKEYIRSKTYPDALPEAALRDRLAHWLRTNELVKKSDVKKEYAVEGLGGKIDILADGEAWELKRDEAYGLDVYQLFAYMDMADIKKGYLLAKSFRDSAKAARDHISKKHHLEITLALLENYPINQPLSEKEIAEYL